MTITAPAENTVVGGDSLTIEATAFDNVGVTEVQFLWHLDAAGLGATTSFDPLRPIGTRTSPPYRIRWSVPKLSCRTKVSLYAWAFDACDNVGESLPVHVEVCN